MAKHDRTRASSVGATAEAANRRGSRAPEIVCESHRVLDGPGPCSVCRCPWFVGNQVYCQRAICYHDWTQHGA
jgi:hypothetical protein